MLLMRRPIPTQKAYAIFGLLLGTLPPAAIFTRIFGGPGAANDYGLVLICLLMNIACALVGYGMGGALGRSVDNLERAPWGQMLGISMLMGLAWGAVTGAAGGMLFFIIGALFGIICAMPVGFIAFALFTPLHRTLARGGVIDARHFWPVASGIIMLIVALILSPHVFPY